MSNSSEHGDLVVVAIIVSLVLHALVMFFAAPHVMSRMGYGTETPRLPLTPLSGKGRAIVEPVMRDLGLL